MTTQSWSTRVRMDSDALFREWGSEFNAKLSAVGLVQTADTGQINWVTVVRPAANTIAGYEIWRFNDSLQATAPIFLKVGYGLGSVLSSPIIQIGVGISSNGSGTLTGADGATPSQRATNSSGQQNTDTTRQSLMCHVAGFFGFDWKIAAGSSEASFFICRTCDSTGAPTATGAIVAWGSGGSSSLTATQAMRFAATAQVYTVQTAPPNTALGLNPQVTSTTVTSGDIQAAIGWMPTPRISPIFGMCGVLDNELTATTTFTVTLVGTTPRTYIACTLNAGPFGPIAASTSGGLKFAMLWE